MGTLPLDMDTPKSLGGSRLKPQILLNLSRVHVGLIVSICVGKLKSKNYFLNLDSVNFIGADNLFHISFQF